MECDKESLSKVNIKYIKFENNEEPRAIIANFPSVISAKNACNSSSFRYFKNSNTLNKAKATQRKLVANTEAKINYEGHLNDASHKSQHKHYVGVYSRKKNKLMLYNAHFINMHMQSDEKSIDGKDNLENKERNDLLIQAFGSVKGKRGIENQRRNHEFKKSVSSTIGFAFEQVDKQSLETNDDDDGRNPLLDYLPPFYETATAPQDVFPWSSLLTEQQMDALTTPSSLFVDSTPEQVQEWSKNNTYPRFILKRLSYLPSEPGERLRRCNFLMFLSRLMHLFLLKSRDLKNKDILPLDTPSILKAALLNKFTTAVPDQKFARNMSAKQRDCLLYHILVACLKLDDCDVVISDLKEDIKARDLQKYYRMMGCKILPCKLPDGKTSKDSMRAVLSVPYVLPNPLRAKAVKRKRK